MLLAQFVHFKVAWIKVRQPLLPNASASTSIYLPGIQKNVPSSFGLGRRIEVINLLNFPISLLLCFFGVCFAIKKTSLPNERTKERNLRSISFWWFSICHLEWGWFLFSYCACNDENGGVSNLRTAKNRSGLQQRRRGSHWGWIYDRNEKRTLVGFIGVFFHRSLRVWVRSPSARFHELSNKLWGETIDWVASDDSSTHVVVHWKSLIRVASSTTVRLSSALFPISHWAFPLLQTRA